MITITGKVIGDIGEDIPLANIEVVGENRFAIADNSGRFTIQANSVNSVLKFSHVAYVWDTISVSEFIKTKEIVLYLDTNALDEVIVTTKPKTDYSMLWIIGVIVVTGIAINSKSNNDTQKD